MKLVMVRHAHHGAAIQHFAQLVQRLLHRRSIAVGRLLQLAKGKSPIGAEENRFDRSRQIAQGCLCSMWIGPNRSFCLTLIAERRRTSRTATNVTTASTRTSSSGVSSASANRPYRS